jgi:hypothetical protein
MPQKKQEYLSTMEDCPKDSVPVMTCGTIHPKFEKYAVKTTHKEIAETILCYSKEPIDLQKHIFAKTLMRMVQYSEEELNEHYTKNNEEWKTFCDDVLDFYCVRHILMKKEIPIFLQ